MSTFLIDANILFAAESDRAIPHVNHEQAARLLRMASTSGHQIWLSPSIKDDLSRIKDSGHKALRTRQVGKYPQLEEIPFPKDFLKLAGYENPNDQDLADATYLLALKQHAVDFVVSEDRGLMRHAEILGVADQTLTLSDAVDTLAAFLAKPVDHPAVFRTEAYQILLDQPIFDDLKNEYAFEAWWQSKVVAERRECITIGPPDALQGFAVLNEEHEESWQLPGRVMKICTFKIDSNATGVKRGEMLLWEIIERARAQNFDSLFVETFPHHEDLRVLFENMGFEEIATKSHTNGTEELVLGKIINSSLASATPLSSLDFHVRFGPGALKPSRTFIVPIIPRWHDMLFPSQSDQLALDVGTTPFGNAYRKAYLCKSPTRKLEPGHILLFERTRVAQAITAVGVVEGTESSRDPQAIRRFVGRRTVYTDSAIARMCSENEVLAIRFRLDRILDPVWSVAELVAEGVFQRSPQSISEVAAGRGLTWVRQQLS